MFMKAVNYNLIEGLLPEVVEGISVYNMLMTPFYSSKMTSSKLDILNSCLCVLNNFQK